MTEILENQNDWEDLLLHFFSAELCNTVAAKYIDNAEPSFDMYVSQSLVDSASSNFHKKGLNVEKLIDPRAPLDHLWSTRTECREVRGYVRRGREESHGGGGHSSTRENAIESSNFLA